MSRVKILRETYYNSLEHPTRHGHITVWRTERRDTRKSSILSSCQHQHQNTMVSHPSVRGPLVEEPQATEGLKILALFSELW
jgi:hypothetical protein